MRSYHVLLGVALLGAPVLGAQTQLSGAGTCGKRDVAQAIAVRDRPNHAFSIAQTQCTWTRPFEIAGIQSKGGTGVQFDEVRDTTARFHGYYLDTMSNGDSAHYRSGLNVYHRPLARRGLIGLLFPAKRDNQCDASSPRRQHVHDRQKLESECWQQQGMETQQSPGENHRHDVNGLFDKRPAQRQQQELERVRRDGHGVGQPHSISR